MNRRNLFKSLAGLLCAPLLPVASLVPESKREYPNNIRKVVSKRVTFYKTKTGEVKIKDDNDGYFYIYRMYDGDTGKFV